jgi:hypothetical protein
MYSIMLRASIISGMERFLLADEGDGLQMWKAADNRQISCHRQTK